MMSEETIDRPVDDMDYGYGYGQKNVPHEPESFYCRFDGATKVEDCTCNDSRNQYGEDND